MYAADLQFCGVAFHLAGNSELADDPRRAAARAWAANPNTAPPVPGHRTLSAIDVRLKGEVGADQGVVAAGFDRALPLVGDAGARQNSGEA